MLINSVPAAAGPRWLLGGLRLLRRQPLGLPAMVGAYLTLLLLPALLPFIGPFLSGVVSPFATVGLMQCCREVDQGRAPTLAQYVQTFRDTRMRDTLFRLGLVNGALLMLVALLAMLLVPAPVGDASPASIEELPLQAALVRVLLYLPVLVLMLFAPLLAGWHGMSPPKAMFGSAVAMLRNFGAMLLYGVTALALVLLASVIALAVLAAIIPSRDILALLTAPIALVLMTVVQASLYPMYLSIFAETPARQPA
ncbi:MAG: BPSS1780 family membrane protein [Betaproteobacteria bacterium]|jgi:hypothetical protein